MPRHDAEPHAAPRKSVRPRRALPADPVLAAAWNRPEVQGALGVVLDAITDIVGFDVAVVAGRVNDDDLRVVAARGDEAVAHVRAGQLSLERARRCSLAGEAWGALTFVAHDRVPPAALEQGWTPSVLPLPTPVDAIGLTPQVWHPHDMLLAVLRDPSGEELGVLWLDVPHTGRRPHALQRRELDGLVALASGALARGLRAERTLADGRRDLVDVRSTIRALSTERGPDAVLTAAVALLRSLDTLDLAWARSFATTPDPTGEFVVRAGDEHRGDPLADDLLLDLRQCVSRAWTQQRLLAVSDDQPGHDLIDPPVHAALLDRLDASTSSRMLLVPVGAGAECHGYLGVSRRADQPEWTEAERDQALAVGRELGSVVLNARTLARERHLLRQQQRLEAIRRRMVSTFSHELRTPIASLGTNLELLAGDLPDDDRTLDALRRNIGRLDRLVTRMLELDVDLEPDDAPAHRLVEISGLARDVVSGLQSEATRNGVDLSYARLTVPVRVRGDVADLARAVTNVVHNAVTFTPAGGRVEVEARQGEGQVTVQVRDSGPGLADEQRAVLFELFSRGPLPVGRPGPHLGLGLHQTHAIVTAHGGRVDVESDPGTGSVFTVVLPLAD